MTKDATPPTILFRVSETCEYEGGRLFPLKRKITADASEMASEELAVHHARRLMIQRGWDNMTLRYGVGEIEMTREKLFGELSARGGIAKATAALREANSAVTLLPEPAQDPVTQQTVDVKIRTGFDDLSKINKVFADVSAMAKNLGKPLRYAFLGVASHAEGDENKTRAQYFSKIQTPHRAF